MNNQKKSTAGITLIALVITIIVLLILAGVAIAALTGENGLLQRAADTNGSSAYSSACEQVKLAYANLKAEVLTQKHTSQNYNAQANGESLATMVGRDLNGSEWSTPTYNSTNKAIEIKYTNSSLRAGMISEGKPAQSGEINFSIGLLAQDVTLSIDGVEEYGSSEPSPGVAYLETAFRGSIEVPAGTTLVDAQWVHEEIEPTGFAYHGDLLNGVVMKTCYIYSPDYGRSFLEKYGYFYQGEALYYEGDYYCDFYDSNNVKLGPDDLLQAGEHYRIDYVSCLLAGTLITVEEDEEDENGNKTKRRKKKKIEELTYKDKLLVWNFDTGEFDVANPLWLSRAKTTTQYNLLKFSDGSELKTINQHRIFNKELGKFTYPMTDETPIGTTTFNEQGEEVKLVSKEIIKENVEYYNVITSYHMNAFAEGILTSCRFSNLYDIKDMKYVKDDRELVLREEYEEIPDEYFYGLRLAEQPKEVNRGNDVKMDNSIVEYIKRLIQSAK